ncbi:MAG: flagellar export chaperone FlgN [Candidatus Latescibacteria bacterium]|nr:flagellar export chaperone FlgN [Candidatus Latescibacterota bacterium]
MDVSEHIQELIHILKREIQSFNAISELLILEEKSLIEFDTKSLTDLIGRQEDVFSSIACLEKSRQDVLVRIGEITGEDPKTMTVSQLSTMVDDPVRKKLIEAGHVLDSVYKDMKLKKSSNAMLIKQGVVLIENDIRTILKALGKTHSDASGYTSASRHNNESGGICIDGRM